MAVSGYTLPHAYNGTGDTAQLWSTDTHQWYAFWKPSDWCMRVGRRTLGARDYSTFDITGAAATEIAQPVENDDHNYPSLCVDDNGVAHLPTNMHDDVLRYIKSAANNPTSWSAASAITDEQPRNTYPMFSARTPNGIMFHCRSGPENVGGGAGDNRSGVGNSMYWVIEPGSSTMTGPVDSFQGVSVPGAGPGGTTGSDFLTADQYNWSAYPGTPFVEPDVSVNPGRLWMAGMWRAGVNDPVTTAPEYPEDGTRTNEMPFCIYSDDITDSTSWKAVDGSSVDMPLVPYLAGEIETDANPAAYLPYGRTDDWPTTGYINGGGMCVNPETGYPTLTLSLNPMWKFEWDGDSWNRTQLGTSGGFTLGGVQVASYINPYYLRDGHLWYLSTRAVGGVAHPALFRADGQREIRMGGQVPTSATTGTSFGAYGGLGWGWGCQADPEAYRKWLRIEVLVPNGDYPQVFSYGGGPRCHIA